MHDLRSSIARLHVMLLLLPVPALAAWHTEGTRLAPAPTAAVASDRRGGVYAAVEWPDRFTNLHRISTTGDSVAGWPTLGTELTPGMRITEHTSIEPIAMLPDDSGGSFTLVAEQFPYQGSGGFLYPVQFFLHRRDAMGRPAPGWTRDGVRLDANWLDHRHETHHLPMLASDGLGGVLVAWLGQDAVPATPVIAVQRVAATGALPWGETAVRVQATPGACTIPAVTSNGHGGALVFWGRWNDTGTRIAIVGQHVSAQGQLLWGSSGREISPHLFRDVAEAVPADGGWMWAMYEPALRAHSDGYGGAIVTWAGAIEGARQVRATRVSAAGQKLWREDRVLSRASADARGIQLTPIDHDMSGVSWLELDARGVSHLFAQRLSRRGDAEWPLHGVELASGPLQSAAIVRGPNGGAYVAWSDSAGLVFAARLLRSGEKATGWLTQEDLIGRAAPTYAPVLAALIESEAHSAIVVWRDPIFGAVGRKLRPQGPADQRELVPHSPPPAPVRAPTIALAVRSLSANPGHGNTLLSIMLPQSATTTLEAMDVAGRRVWARELGVLGVGEHSVRLFDGQRPPSGLYFVRLRQGERVATMRLTVLP